LALISGRTEHERTFFSAFDNQRGDLKMHFGDGAVCWMVGTVYILIKNAITSGLMREKFLSIIRPFFATGAYPSIATALLTNDPLCLEDRKGRSFLV